MDEPRQLHQVLGGQIATKACRLNKEVDILNHSIKDESTISPDNLLMPALSRSIADHTLDYMEEMLKHKTIANKFKQLNNLG